MEAGEAIKEGKMLRFEDGTPVNIEYNASGSGEYEIGRSGFRVKTGETKNFTPRFSSSPEYGSVIKIGQDANARYFEITNPYHGQRKPDSIYAAGISKEEFNLLIEHGAKVVQPDNEPEGLK